jgi:hypothetical protein
MDEWLIGGRRVGGQLAGLCLVPRQLYKNKKQVTSQVWRLGLRF